MKDNELKHHQEKLGEEDERYERLCAGARARGESNPPRQARPLRESAAHPIVELLLEIGNHEAVLQMMSVRLLQVTAEEMPRAFTAWVRSRFTQPSEQFGLRQCLVGPGWFAPPVSSPALPDVGTNARATYQIKHFEMFEDLQSAAEVLKRYRLSVKVDQHPALANYLRQRQYATRNDAKPVRLLETAETISIQD
jgi:hypothetical protein